MALGRFRGLCASVLLPACLTLPAAPVSGEAVSITLFAQADCRGELRACACPGQESGGFALRATVFKRARSLGHPYLLVDAGDFTGDAGDPLLSERFELYVDAMERLGYHAVGLGERELALTPEAVASAASRLPFVCANLEGGERLGIPRIRRIELEGVTVLVTAYLDPRLVPGNSDWRLLDPVASLREILAAEAKAGAASPVCLLAHASTASVRETLGALSGVDVAVRGHEPEGGPELTPVGKVPLVLPDALGRNVVQATLSFDLAGELLDRRTRTWELKQLTGSDAKLDVLVREFEAAHGLEP